MIRLRQLLADVAVDFSTSSDADPAVADVTIDSRRVGKGTLFCACPGATSNSRHGLEFVDLAIAAGAAAVVADEPVDNLDIPLFVVDDARRAAARLAERLAGAPSSKLKLLGVTGTDGKTTVTHMVAEAWGKCGRGRGAVMGTLGVGVPPTLRPLGFTTPEAETLSLQLADLVDDNVDAVALEVSSHALSTRRVDGLEFDVAALTNLTPEHLDFHGDMEGYARAKARLFLELNASDGVWVLPADGLHPALATILNSAASSSTKIIRWGEGKRADLVGSDIRCDVRGTSMRIRHGGRSADVRSPLLGRHNAQNLMTAGAALLGMGASVDDVALGLSAAQGVPGRFQRIGAAGSPTVIVDYAHTPNGLEHAISAARALGARRLAVVVGCGGDRDREKRASMAAHAAEAELTVFTTDNPRSEDPEAIIAQMMNGLSAPARNNLHTIADRREAIASALDWAGPDDVVLVAGKGDERFQLVGTEKRPFHDATVIEELLGVTHA